MMSLLFLKFGEPDGFSRNKRWLDARSAFCWRRLINTQAKCCFPLVRNWLPFGKYPTLVLPWIFKMRCLIGVALNDYLRPFEHSCKSTQGWNYEVSIVEWRASKNCQLRRSLNIDGCLFYTRYWIALWKSMIPSLQSGLRNLNAFIFQICLE